ncbi:hypothetical protein [Georgenia deserti]|uniref:Transcriptional regulator, AbiEi antitoxin, Type IV TA system n=1 Tax=Georgenia deserti TaxID=2093781 RepID=A0ABW4L0M9_9MICO
MSSVPPSHIASQIVTTRGLERLGGDVGARQARALGLRTLRRGAFVGREVWDAATRDERYLMTVLATTRAMREEPLLSHESAAVLHGLPVVGPWPGKTHVLVDSPRGGRSSGAVVRHGVSSLPDGVEIGGHIVTSVVRTVVDLARTRPFVSSLATADHALRTGMCTRDELMAELDGVRGRRGCRRARAVVERADPRAESVGESLTRAQMYLLGVPVPELQVEFRDEEGRIGRVDFWWADRRLVGEFDGRAKYGADGGDPGETVWREKRREDRLRQHPEVNDVLRWIWAEAHDQARFSRVLGRAGLLPP